MGHLTPTHRGASDLGFKTSADLQHPEATERSECQGWRDGVDHFPEWSHISINNPGLPVSFPGPRGLEVVPPLLPRPGVVRAGVLDLGRPSAPRNDCGFGVSGLGDGATPRVVIGMSCSPEDRLYSPESSFGTRCWTDSGTVHSGP